MASLLYLDGKLTVPETKESIKLTKENPYFTDSESWTLDVTLPMDILENRQALQNLQRMDASKQMPSMRALLVVGNKPMLDGSARVTQVTEKAVKVQLLGGRSEVNFLSADNKTYIDEMDLGVVVPQNSGGSFGGNAADATFTSTSGIRFKFLPIHDETEGHWTNLSGFLLRKAVQPCLLDVMTEVLRLSGYSLTANAVGCEPWDSLYVASAKRTHNIARALPHWLVKDFVAEFCRFFNVTLVIDQVAKTCRFVNNRDFFGSSRTTTIEPVSEYTAEVSQEAEGHALASDNLSFDMSSSANHDYDVIPDSLRDYENTVVYSSKSSMETAYAGMSDADKRKSILICPVGVFTAWDHDYSDCGQEEPVTLLTKIDVFGPLIRAEDAGETQLKIVPAAIYAGAIDIGQLPWIAMPAVENPTGNDAVEISGSRSSQPSEPATVQDYILGNADFDGNAEKEDRLQVMFVDDVQQSFGDSLMLMGFVDWQFKKSHKGNEHRHWSLSLNPTDADHYLGELHQNGFVFNMKAKHCFKFLADAIPDPTRVYIIRNKRYGCEKIEASIKDGQLDRLMTGYFYEML